MANREEEDKIFNKKMERLRVREQNLASNLDQLDAEMREFREDVAAFHVRRAHVHALMQQEQLQQQHPVADALNTFGSTQIVGVPTPIRQDARPAVPTSINPSDEPVAPVSAPFQDPQPTIDDGQSLFIPEQPRATEQVNFKPNPLKRPMTFAEAEEFVARKYAARDSETSAQKSDAESVANGNAPEDAYDEEDQPESKGNRRVHKRVRFA